MTVSVFSVRNFFSASVIWPAEIEQISVKINVTEKCLSRMTVGFEYLKSVWLQSDKVIKINRKGI
jgi:hypothetical protein